MFNLKWSGHAGHNEKEKTLHAKGYIRVEGEARCKNKERSATQSIHKKGDLWEEREKTEGRWT